MDYTTEYRKAIGKHLHWLKMKEDRITFLETYYKSQGKDAKSIDYLIDKDQLVNKYAGKAARFAGEAAAYGPGMIIEILGRNQ